MSELVPGHKIAWDWTGMLRGQFNVWCSCGWQKNNASFHGYHFPETVAMAAESLAEHLVTAARAQTPDPSHDIFPCVVRYGAYEPGSLSGPCIWPVEDKEKAKARVLQEAAERPGATMHLLECRTIGTARIPNAVEVLGEMAGETHEVTHEK